MVPMSEIRDAVRTILQEKSEKSNIVNVPLKKKPGKYDNIKSKVALQWNLNKK